MNPKLILCALSIMAILPAMADANCVANGRVCVGDHAVDSFAQTCKIVGIYNDTLVSIQRDSGEIKAEYANQLGIRKGCGTRFCVGDKVIDSNATPAVVIAVWTGDTDYVFLSNEIQSEYYLEKENDLAKMN